MTTSAARIEEISYQGWPNSYRIANGDVEIVITGDIGPRIMRYGFAGGQNLFKEFPDGLGKSGEAAWQPRGGHRIWVAPEHREKSYAPDNSPVKIAIRGDVLEATQPVEPLTGLEKQIAVKMSPAGSTVEVVHRIRNTNSQSVQWAPWTITMMAPGGVGIHGFPPRGTHPEILAPSNPLTMWAFTDLTDPRWLLLRKYLILRQDPANKGQPQKLGTFNHATWGAYLLGSDLFIKRYQADPAKQHPDFGCSFEMFCNADVLELETLGPITPIEPGAAIEHTERWSLHKNVAVNAWTDAELDRVIAPLAAR